MREYYVCRQSRGSKPQKAIYSTVFCGKIVSRWPKVGAFSLLGARLLCAPTVGTASIESLQSLPTSSLSTAEWLFDSNGNTDLVVPAPLPIWNRGGAIWRYSTLYQRPWIRRALPIGRCFPTTLYDTIWIRSPLPEGMEVGKNRRVLSRHAWVNQNDCSRSS